MAEICPLVLPFCDVVVDNSLPLSLFPILISENNGKEGLVGIAKHFANGSSSSSVKISRRSALILKGNVVIKSLNLDGALVVDAGDCQIVIDVPVDYVLTNAGWKVKPVSPNDDHEDEAHRLRGIKFIEEDTSVFKIPANNNNTGGGVESEEKRIFALVLDDKSGHPVLVNNRNVQTSNL